MLSLNVRSRNGKKTNDYYAVLIQLNYDQVFAEKSKSFFTALYFELTVNFGFNFVDRVFYKVDSKETITSLLGAAIRVIMLQQRLSGEDIRSIMKQAFIIPLHQFDDLKDSILP